ncbi:MAG: hypothetical protein OQK04_19005, partial [Kangiellaceae bacterium]|nr:hypothetical protein [Kangiellaceae bacterium]
LKNRVSLEGVEWISDLIGRVVYEREFAFKIINDFSINVTSFFRDENFFSTIRKKVVPYLKTFPYFKIWHAGCATGEEVYSMAIILKEEGIYDRARLYATDINHAALLHARESIYSNSDINKAQKSYKNCGGKLSLEDYFYSRYNSSIVSPSLSSNVTFAAHNLVNDGVFGEMQLIICRNVMIYFNNELKRQVIKLFKSSLCPGGMLCTGNKESISGLTKDCEFNVFDNKAKIYKLDQERYEPSTYY